MIDASNNQNNTGSNPVSFDQQTIEQWQALAEKSLKGQSLESLTRITPGQITTHPLYTQRPESQTALQPSPLKRWDNRLAVLGTTNSEKNANVLAGLAGGISSLQLSMENNTLDDTDQNATLSAADLLAIFKDVQLNIVPVSLLSGKHFTANAKTMESVFAKLGVPINDTCIAFNADPIGYMAQSGDEQIDLPVLLNELVVLAKHTLQNLPKSTTVCVNASCYHNAGGSIEQELVATIATASIYMQSMLDAGIKAQDACDTLAFQLSCDADVLSNVVKLRVLKSLWHHVATAMGAEKPGCQLTVESSKRMQSLMSPWNNHLRNVSSATAAAMGGAQSIVIHPHNYIDNQFLDKDIALSARVARNIPIIVSEESHLNFVHDPMAGAYSVESISTTLSNACWQSLQQLERDGGLIDALQTGRYQTAIAHSQKQRIQRLSDEQDVQVGVNRYVNPDDTANLNKTAPDSTLSDRALIVKRDAQSFEVTS